jgi:hypothetical protein
MKKRGLEKFIRSDYAQLGLVLLALLALIMFSLIMIQTMVNKRFLMDAIFLSLTIAGGVTGFYTTRLEVRKRGQLGITRKSLFFSFTQKVLSIVFILFCLELYYAVMFKWINAPIESLWAIIDLKKIVLLMLLFSFFSYSGMMFGMIRSKKVLPIVLLIGGIGISITLLIIEVSYFVIFLLAIGLPILYYFSYYLFLKIEV